MKFRESFSKARSEMFIMDVIRSVRRDVGVNYCFDTYYYALRFVKTGCRRSFGLIFAGSPNGDNAYALFQIQAFFKKREDLEVGVDKAAVALDAFLSAEKLCREASETLRDRNDPNYSDRAALIFKMQSKISYALGDVPEPSKLEFSFGKGSNVGCSQITNVAHKCASDATLTVGAARYLQGLPRESFPHWLGGTRLQLCEGSRFTTVPKTWKTDRGITVEPIVNAFLQRGYGIYIRDRLRTHCGQNVRDQSVNQRLALKGSRDGSLATIDLSMASDLIYTPLVMDLLPFPWFDALDLIRSKSVVLPDESYHILEKFSGMGNGFTFELETLIFWALCTSVCPNGATISVYGDDIIVESKYFDDVMAALRLLGFIPNPDKSFGSGPFRESCGADYWDGVSVRPFFLTDAPSVKELFKLHNWCYRSGYLPSVCSLVIEYLPLKWRRFGPDGVGDGHLVADLTSFRVKVDKRGWGWFVKYKTMATCAWEHDPIGLCAEYASFLYFTTHKSLQEDMCWEDFGRTFRPREASYTSRTLTLYCHFGTGDAR